MVILVSIWATGVFLFLVAFVMFRLLTMYVETYRLALKVAALKHPFNPDKEYRGAIAKSAATLFAVSPQSILEAELTRLQLELLKNNGVPYGEP